MSYDFELKFDCENAAFEDDMEVVRILQDVLNRVARYEDMSKYRNVFDSNGNKVGVVRFKKEDENNGNR